MEVRDSETSKKEKREQTKPLPSRCSFGEDPPKKRDREKRIPFVRSEGEAPLTANGSMWI
jgi:hypothetical protein